MLPNGALASSTFTGGGAAEGEFAFSLRDVAQVILRRLWVVVLVVLVFVGAAVGVSLLQTPAYQASAKLMVGQEQQEQQFNLAGSVEGLQQLTQTMIIAIKTRTVATDVIERLELQAGPGELLGDLTVEQVETSQFIQLTYTDTDPDRATQVVNTVGEVSSERIAETPASSNNITATLYEPAVVPDTPVSPDPLRNGILAAALGLMLGIGLALLMEYLDDSWRSPEEVEQVSGVPTFAAVPEFKLTKSKKKKGR